MRAMPPEELLALRRAAFGPRPEGMDAGEHDRVVAGALDRLRELDLRDDPDAPAPVETAETAEPASAPAAPDVSEPDPPTPAPRPRSRRVTAIWAAGVLIATVAASGFVGWRLAAAQVEPSVGGGVLTSGLAIGELRTVADWGGRTVLVGDWLGHEGLECIVVAYGVDGGGASCGDPPTIGLSIDPGALGSSTQTTYELAEFTWHRGRGLIIQYRGEVTLIDEPGDVDGVVARRATIP